MDIKKWKHAVTLAEEGSFAKAAARLHLTQPALSRSIQSLENELGVILFDRQHSGVFKTVAGRLLIERSRELLRIANGLQHEADLIRDIRTGNLAFGSSSIAAQALLPQVLTTVLKEPNQFKIEVDTQPYHVLLDQLLNESLEFFISHTRTLQSRQDVSIEPLGNLPLGFFVRRGHQLSSAERSVDMKLIRQFPLVSHVLSDYLYDKKMGEESVLANWPSRLFSENATILKALTKDADAILMTAQGLVSAELAAGDFVRLQAKELGQNRFTELGIVRLAHRSLSPLALRVIDTIKSHMVTGQVT